MTAEIISIPELPPEESQQPEGVEGAEGQSEGRLEGSEEQHNADAPADAEADATQAQTLLEKAGLNLAEFQREFAETGALSEASYKKLTDAGFPREIVDSFIDGVKAKAERVKGEILAAAGATEEEVRCWTSWGRHGLSASEQAAFNAMVQDPTTAALALASLRAKYEAANGRPPKRLIQGENSSGAGGSYSTRAEIVKDMKDSRYKTDAAFRQQVINKIARSPRAV